jgi:hypothetical protein
MARRSDVLYPRAAARAFPQVVVTLAVGLAFVLRSHGGRGA